MLLKAKQMLVGTAMGRSIKCAADAKRLAAFSFTVRGEAAEYAFQTRCAERFLPMLCDPDSTFVDIGAHIGSVCAEVLRRHPLIGLIAIEAVPDKAKALARKFPKAIVHECAAGESEDEWRFTWIPNAQASAACAYPDRAATGSRKFWFP